MSKQGGYSLLELLIVLALLMLVVAFTVHYSYMDRNSAETLIVEAARRARARRAEAVKLSAAIGAGSIERTLSQPPLVIDFAQPDTTRTLRIDGAGATQLICPATHPRSPLGLCEKINPDETRERTMGAWQYAYAGLGMELPAGWSVVASAADLAAAQIPPLPDSQLTTRLEFTSRGTAPPVAPNPATATAPSVARTWVVYFVKGDAARALSVSDAGHVEVCRWENGEWRGFGGRLITTNNLGPS